MSQITTKPGISNSESALTNEFTCSFCNSHRMSLVIDFGEVALAGGFLKPDQFTSERKFPLRVYFCHDCYSVQVVDKVPADVLFNNYFYFSSSINTLRDHFRGYAEEVASRFLDDPSSATVLEFGCNDGVLLRPLADQCIKTVIGVDPAKNIVATINDPRIQVINDFFTETVADQIVERFGKVDLIMANNVFAHIPDIQGTTRAVEKALSDEGVFAFEVHYLGKVLDELQYDMIYHEHLYYYSLLSAMSHFSRYGMVVFDIKPIPIHAGSIRFYVCKNGSHHAQSISKAVRDLEAEERSRGFDSYDTFLRFSDQVMSHRVELISLLENIRRKGGKIAGYGASGRANTMIQFCGITQKHLDYMIDDAPAKTGYFTPGSHFEIRSGSVLQSEDAPEYLLVFAWSFFEEIQKRNAAYLEKGGKMILPLPSVQVFSSAEKRER